MLIILSLMQGSSLLPQGGWWRRESLLVAASAGLDSTVLLDLLAGRARVPADGFRLGAAYLDHGLRGVEGARDAELVAELCARRGVPFFAGAADVSRLARRSRRSLEAAGREARYAFLAAVARREGYAAVVTAHHAGDQVETLLWRLARGGRPEGLAGILSVARLAGVEVVRPLLEVDPKRILSYAEERGVPFREDATNRDPRFLRNRLRRLVAPRVRPRDAAALVRLFGLERRLVESAGERFEARLVAAAEAGVRLPAAPLAALHARLRREVLRRAFHRVARPSDPLPERALDLVEGLLASPRGGAAALPGVRARVSCGWLMLERAGPAREPVPARLRMFSAEPLCEAFDAAEVEGPLVLRSWEPGDRIAASHGRKKLKELFREARVPAWERPRYPVLADARGVLWVVGLRRGTRALPRPGRPALRVRIGSGGRRGSVSVDVEFSRSL
jgi:tRNA(Ile)-lysidine synthase